MAKKTVSNEFMQTFDIAEIKAKLEDIPSYEEKIEYLEKTSIGLKIRYELLQPRGAPPFLVSRPSPATILQWSSMLQCSLGGSTL